MSFLPSSILSTKLASFSPCGASSKKLTMMQLIWPSTLTCGIPSYLQQYVPSKRKEMNGQERAARNLIASLPIYDHIDPSPLSNRKDKIILFQKQRDKRYIIGLYLTKHNN
jgi:hypothetical protein